MKCIICALDTEYESVKAFFNSVKETCIDDTFSICECESNDIILVKSGIGKALAYKHTEYIFNNYKDVETVYSVGIAGAMSDDINIGDIVVADVVLNLNINDCVNECTASDIIDSCCNKVDCISSLNDDLSITEYNVNDSKDLFKIINDNYEDGKVVLGKVLSTDFIVSNLDLRNKLYDKTASICVEMESGGIAEICSKKNKKFFAIKIISDFADDNALNSMLKRQIALMRNMGRILKNTFINK